MLLATTGTGTDDADSRRPQQQNDTPAEVRGWIAAAYWFF
jgi:hypothetical protein